MQDTANNNKKIQQFRAAYYNRMYKQKLTIWGKPLRLTVFFFFLFAMVFILWSSPQEPQLLENEKSSKSEMNRLRQLGDKAFRDGLFHLALKFYVKYYEVAEALNNDSSIIDASECLISTYVNSGNAVAAKAVFDKTTTEYQSNISEDKQLKSRFTFWKGNIELASGKPDAAIKTFNHLQENLSQNNELLLQTLDAKGTAQARLLKWPEAEKTYALLEFAAPSGSKWKQIALKKRVLALLMSEDFSKAKQLIQKLKQKNNIYSAITKILLSIKNNDLSTAFKQYNTIRKYARGADILWFLMAETLSKAFLKNKEYDKALFVLNDAVIYASSEYDRQSTLLKIINAAVMAKKNDAAVTTAERFLKNYPDSFISNEIRLRLANLYSGEKKAQDALQVYETVLNDPNAAFKQKVESARSAARIFITQKDYKSAKEKFEFMVQKGKEDKVRGEGEFWLAELLYLQERYSEAAEAFNQVSVIYHNWREQASFKEIKSLVFAMEFNKITPVTEKFLKAFPKSEYIPEVMFLKGLSFEKQKKFKEAQKSYKKFVSLYPNNEYAPRAMFEIATIELEHGKTEDSVIAYTEMIKKYPASNLIPNALYRRMNACFWCGFSMKGTQDAQKLLNDYPQSNFTEYAGFTLADYYVSNKHYDQAVDVYKKMLLIYKNNKEKSAEMLYEIAEVRFKQDEFAMALNVLDELSEKYSNTEIAGNGLLLRGDILTGKSEYEQAVPFFIKASTIPNRPQLQLSALGRLGDVYLALGSKTPDGTNYLKSAKYYSEVLTHPNLTARFRDQALYKLGRCEELFGDKGKAISRYHEAIYNYELDAELGRKEASASVWFAKSALAAARLYLEKNTPESAEAAIAIYKTLIKVGVEPIDDFKRKISKIGIKYKLKE